MKHEKLISYGGGVNSTALVILLLQEGFRYPIVYSDLGSEMPETVEYVEKFKKWLIDNYQVKMKILNPKVTPKYFDPRLRKYDSIESYCIGQGIVPFRMARWCTKDWKIKPIQRWGKEHGIFTHLIAFSSEESHRKSQIEGKYERRHPLIALDIDRDECKNIIERAGLPVPPKSSCFFCMYRKKREWAILKANYPDLFERAGKIEEAASRRAGRKVTMRSDNISIFEIGEIINEQNPLFPELRDLSNEICPFCTL
jgi:PP-loop superfamily ATP-utilizing enzyme